MNNGRISRPVSYVSFALNYYLDGLNVYGYHVVNFIIHYLSSIFLFLFVYNTLRLPGQRELYKKHAYSIAFLGTLFWALNPVHVTAVTYIVQRMASMSALFYIMSMYFYLKFRTSGKKLSSFLFVICCILCGLLSIGSKENAVMLPFSILLYDLFFFQGLAKENIKKNIKMVIIPLLILVVAVLLFYDFSADLKDYEQRPFTMSERLLTQPRVVLFYISLLFYPLTSRLTLIHDMAISRSFLDPWTTLAAILIITSIICISLFKAKKWPLVSYCILFFFLNHVIESSFFSLELIFEHRNYLPSMLIFVPLAIGFIYGLEYFSTRKAIFNLLVAVCTSFIIIFAVTVRIQNDIMKDEISLWSDNVEKSPRLHHPRQCLAVALFMAGRLPEAFSELQRALLAVESGRKTKKSLTLGCLGEYYFVTGKDDLALEQLKKSINFYPPYSYIPLSFDRLAIIYMKRGSLDMAEKMTRKSISLKPQEPGFYLTYSAVLLKKKEPDAAIREAQKAMRLRPDLPLSYLRIADAFALKKNRSAERHFRMLGEAIIMRYDKTSTYI